MLQINLNKVYREAIDVFARTGYSGKRKNVRVSPARHASKARRAGLCGAVAK
jgi:hypothetical protein